MPTNLKSLLSRSRSKNELKLRESKDEISPSGNSKSSSSCSEDCTCESSGNHPACLKDAPSYSCRQSSSESSLCSVTKVGSYSSQQSENDSSDENCCYPPPPLASDLSYSNNCCKSDESRGGDFCLMSENFLKSINSESNPSTTTATMIPSSGSSFHNTSWLPSQHHHHHHQQQQQHDHQHHHLQDGHCGAYPCGSSCSSQNYTTYEMQGPSMVAAGNSTGDYCGGGGGYYLGEKSGLAACTSRLVGVGGSNVMDQSDNNVEMRRNASCKTLFFSCTTLHHQPSCNSFESSHMDSTSEFSPGSCENPAGFCVTSSSGNAAAVSSASSIKIPTLSHQQQHHHHHHHQARNVAADGCGSLAYGPPSACCTSSSAANVKDGSPCQSLSLRKCETVLALSNFNGNSITATTNTITSSNAKSYIRNPASSSSSSGGAPTTTYSNFPATTLSGGASSQLSSSSAVAAAAAVPSTNVGGKVKVMKEKIFSTSSSALNCLLHSSSRTGKFLSGWKLSSANSSSNSGSNSNVGRISNMFSGSSEGSNCLGVSCHQPNKHFLGSSGISSTPAAAAASSSGNSSSSGSNSTSDNNKVGSSASAKVTGHQHPHSHHHPHHHHHKSRSQLSISENSFSNSPAPLTPVNRLRRNVSVNNTSLFCPATSGGSLSAHSSYSRSSSVASFGWKEKEDPFEQSLECRLCLYKVRLEDTMKIHACSCRYCKDCLITYVSFEIQQGADEIACPDASCEKQGVMGLLEVEQLVPPMLLEKHKKFRLFREVERDSNLMWCPSPGCETVCHIQDGSSILTGGFVTESDSRGATHGGATIAGGSRTLPFINCPTCRKTYCAEYKLSWHPDSSCESFRRKLIKQGKLSSEDDELFSLDSIKKCPFCHVPIEKDSGCAQMMCKRCKHVFCWYCLASLDDDFLLRHYDKGPCKNKLGHSRASVVWHRAQVIGIFAGFGVLVLLASSLLILAAPCLLCCRCRYCANKLDPEESDLV